MANPWRGWATAGVLTDPAAGTVLADTGPLPEAVFRVRVVLWVTMGLVVALQHRDTPNTGALKSQRLPAAFPMPPWDVELTAREGERVRLVVESEGPTGVEVQASIFHRPIGPPLR